MFSHETTHCVQKKIFEIITIAVVTQIFYWVWSTGVFIRFVKFDDIGVVCGEHNGTYRLPVVLKYRFSVKPLLPYKLTCETYILYIITFKVATKAGKSFIPCQELTTSIASKMKKRVNAICSECMIKER